MLAADAHLDSPVLGHAFFRNAHGGTHYLEASDDGAAAVDGLLPIGDVIGAIVIVSAGAYDLSQPGPGTGNCTRLFHGMLQSAVNAAKIETALLGKCKDTDCCWLLKIKAATWLKNAIARDTINSKCYQGGDSGHRKASEQALSLIHI